MPLEDDNPYLNLKPKPGSSFTLRATGFSMRPVIMAGDLLHIDAAPLKTIRVGDVVLFRRDGHIIAHRLVKKERESGLLIEKGDSKYMPYVLDADSIWGKVVAIEHEGVTISLESAIERVRGRLIAYKSYFKYILINFLSGIKRRTLGRSERFHR